MNRGLLFSPARSRLITIASSKAMLSSCTVPSTPQICQRSLGSKAIATSIPTTIIITRSTTPHRNQQQRSRAIVASAWRRDDSSDEGSDHAPVGRIEIITGPMFSGKSTELLRRAAEHEAAGRRVALVSSSKDTRYGVSSVVTHAGVTRRCISVSRLSDLRVAIESGSGSIERESSAAIDKAAAATATAAAIAAVPSSTALLPSLDSYDVIAIDEAQFFDDLVPFATAMADGRGGGGSEVDHSSSPSPLSSPSPSSSTLTAAVAAKSRAFTLLVAGLDGDWTRSAFGGVLQLVPHAESVTRLAARCAFCGEEAHFSVRLSSSSSWSSSSNSPSAQLGAASVPAPTLQNSSPSPPTAPPQPQVQVGGAESYSPACRKHYLQHSSSTGGVNNASKVFVDRQN